MRSDWKAARTRLPVSWGALGTIVVGVMLARWTWLLFAPHEMSVVAPDMQRHSDAAGNLFNTGANTGTGKTGLAELQNVRLTGIFAGSPGFAILELNGNKQVGVPLGGEIVHGVRLEEMSADHVVIAGDGIRQRIDLKWGKAAASAGTGPRQLMGGTAH